MIFNTLFNRLFNKVTLTKVFIIFSVGLFSRVFINYFYGVNVFIEYTNVISLVYYGAMSIFIVSVNEAVEYFGFNIWTPLCNFFFYISSFLRYFISLCFNLFRYLLFGERYFTLGGDGSHTRKPFDFKQERFVLKKNWWDGPKSGKELVKEPSSGHRNHRRIRIRDRDEFTSAGVSGLREEAARRTFRELHESDRSGAHGGHSSTIGNTNVDQSEFNTSPLQKLKCRVLWITKYQFGHQYNNYYDFKNSLTGDISIRQAVKNIFK